jgi:MscS family membrane protein
MCRAAGPAARRIALKHRLLAILFALVLPMLAMTQAVAQAPAAPATTPAPATAPAPAPAKAEKDPFGRETPQGMVSGLMDALASGDDERALRYFETDSVPGISKWYPLSGTDLAKRFQELLDRAGVVATPAGLSNDPSGNVNDGLAMDIERFGSVKAPDREVPLLAKRVERDKRQVWLVSEATLKEIPTLSRSVDVVSWSGGWLERLPRGPSIAGAPASHWLALISATFLSFLLAWALTALRGPVEAFIRRRHGGETRLTRFIEASAGPVRVILMLIFFGIISHMLEVSIVARYRAIFVAHIVFWLAITWLIWRWVDAGSEIVLGRMSRRGQLTAYSAVSFLNRAIKALLAVLFIAALLRAFGVDVTAGLAALGVGGLAIALGAQKLFENLIGSLTLIADRPVRIGDFCRFGTTLGTVEEIGIRSTRIRTLDRTVLTVPNGEFSSLHIENFSHRDRFWFHPILNLRYETTPEQMRRVLQALREMLKAHPKVEHDSARVRLIGLAAYSLDVEIFAYVVARNHDEFLEIQESLLLNCMDIVDTCGTGFAFPSQTLYLGRDGGLAAALMAPKAAE